MSEVEASLGRMGARGYPTSTDLRRMGGLVRYLRALSLHTGVSFYTLRSRWYQGIRGEWLTVRAGTAIPRSVRLPPKMRWTTPVTAVMIVRTPYGHYDASGRIPVRFWPAWILPRLVGRCETTGRGTGADRELLG